MLQNVLSWHQTIVNIQSTKPNVIMMTEWLLILSPTTINLIFEITSGDIIRDLTHHWLITFFMMEAINCMTVTELVTFLIITLYLFSRHFPSILTLLGILLKLLSMILFMATLLILLPCMILILYFQISRPLILLVQITSLAVFLLIVNRKLWLSQ